MSSLDRYTCSKDMSLIHLDCGEGDFIRLYFG